MMRESDVPMIFIKRFWTTYEPVIPPIEYLAKGEKPKPQKIELDEFGVPKLPEMRNVDWVEYGPVGGAQYLMITEKVARLAAVQPLEGKGANNPAVLMANMRWDAIRPQYEAWKKGLAATLDGIPLAAWPGISAEQATHLRMHGVYTVEDVSKLTDTHRQRLRIPNLGDMIENAKRFLTAQDKTSVTRALEQRDAKIDELQNQITELVEMVKERQAAPVAADAGEPPKRRGRPPGPPKQPEQVEAA